jgi:hypothetical protein
MSQSHQVPKLVWLVTVLIAVILGIWPGIVVTLDHYTGLATLIGWVFVPIGIYDILHNLMTGQFHPDELGQFQELMLLAYPFAMVGYSLCASWTIRCTGVMHKGLLVVVVAAFVSALVTIPVAIITMNDLQHLNMDVFSLLIGYVPALGFHLVILIQLLISAVLGWLISAGLVRLRRRHRLVLV